jgi:hypothetical protein
MYQYVQPWNWWGILPLAMVNQDFHSPAPDGWEAALC